MDILVIAILATIGNCLSYPLVSWAMKRWRDEKRAQADREAALLDRVGSYASLGCAEREALLGKIKERLAL